MAVLSTSVAPRSSPCSQSPDSSSAGGAVPRRIRCADPLELPAPPDPVLVQLSEKVVKAYHRPQATRPGSGRPVDKLAVIAERRRGVTRGRSPSCR